MIEQRISRATRAGLTLSISLVLIGLTVACSQRSHATQSSQPTNQPSSQATTPTAINEEIFTVVEVPPSFPGGNAEINRYLRKNMRYPEAASIAKAKGRVFVSFIVTKEGRIQDVTILKGQGYGLDEEAKRLVETMPNWTPGRQAGRPVHVRYNLVVPFELEK